MTEFLQLLVNGLAIGSILALGGAGASVVFGVLKIGNFAYGEYMAVGAFAGFIATVSLRLHLALGILVAAVATAVFSVALSRIIFRPMRGRGTTSIFIISIGLSLVLRNVLFLVFGSAGRAFDVDESAVLTIGVVRLSIGQATTLLTAAVVMLALGWFVSTTDVGRSMRAVSERPQLAAVVGVNTDRVESLTWYLSGALAGVAGMLLALSQGIFDPSLGWSVLFLVFTAVILGGIGSILGALLGGLTLGVVMELSGWSVLGGGLDTRFQFVLAFAVLIGLLMFRPQGFFGKARLL